MDITLYYQEKGTKEPLILLHGNGGNGSYFQHQMDYFSNRYRMIAVDTRGHGKSPRGTKPFSFEQFACDLYDFMEELGISKAIILGFSDGANIAMQFAVKYPNKVKALILNSGNINPRGVKRTALLSFKREYKAAKQAALKSTDAKKNVEMLSLIVNEPNIKPKELSKITAPTLVICGSNDMIRESHTKKIAKSIPHAELSIIEGDHCIANNRPDVFNKEIEDFLEIIR